MGCSAFRKKKKNLAISLSASIPISRGSFLLKNNSKFQANYKEIRTLGSGAFAEVKLCHHNQTSSLRAVKIIQKTGLSFQQRDPKYLLKEISVLISLDHPNIASYYEIFEDPWKYCIAMEYCPGGDLFTRICSMRKFSENNASEIMSQLLSAIAHCHEKHIIHRDLKPENILMAENSDSLFLKVADFGNSCYNLEDSVVKGNFGSAYYVAPEVLASQYNEKCDVWSLGIILFILIAGKAPYKGNNSTEILKCVKTRPLQIYDGELEDISPECLDLLKKMLDIDPSSRISAKEALDHCWIKSCKNNKGDFDLSKSLNRLQKFHSSVKLKDAVYTYIATNNILESEKKYLTSCFQALDKNSDGKISKEELLEKYLEIMKEESAEEAVNKIIQETDKNLNGEVDYSEFVVACMSRKKYLNRDILMTAFKLFDIDESGFITYDEIRSILGKEKNFPKEAWQGIIKEVDENGDGVIDIKEFIGLMINEHQ